jgi:hypothetical protein
MALPRFKGNLPSTGVVREEGNDQIPLCGKHGYVTADGVGRIKRNRRAIGSGTLCEDVEIMAYTELVLAQRTNGGTAYHVDG